jgi:excisionase family DNA binding protein
MFDVGVKPDAQVDGIRDWRDQVLLRILGELKAMRRADEAPPEDDATAGDGWLDVEQVAAYLKLTPKTVREGAAKGTLLGHKYPPRCIRGRWRFKKDELDKGLAKRCGSPRRAPVEQTVWK